MRLADISSNISFSKDMPITKEIYGSEMRVLGCSVWRRSKQYLREDKEELALGIFVEVPVNVTPA